MKLVNETDYNDSTLRLIIGTCIDIIEKKQGSKIKTRNLEIGFYTCSQFEQERKKRGLKLPAYRIIYGCAFIREKKELFRTKKEFVIQIAYNKSLVDLVQTIMHELFHVWDFQHYINDDLFIFESGLAHFTKTVIYDLEDRVSNFLIYGLPEFDLRLKQLERG